MFTEEQKLSCAAGELIHGLGTIIADEAIKFGSLTISDGQLLQELGAALRQQELRLSGSFPALRRAGVTPSQMTRTELVDLADTILNKAIRSRKPRCD
ncbi:hypothetical protein I6M49_22055 [Shewanella algae]|uniref:hypothetical protein n=1 Tax=Shewanella algae TaxID=38313 RepID=UPI001AAD1916|nr:hypothetical protein [Shewanella algae]MBO2656129.1 hypothetical protein [Shewanella algae]